jgi:hypothetical protein
MIRLDSIGDQKPAKFLGALVEHRLPSELESLVARRNGKMGRKEMVLGRFPGLVGCERVEQVTLPVLQLTCR